MIKTVGDLLDRLIAVEQNKLKAFENLGHPGMIGDIYEGLAIELLRKTLIPGPELKVVEGKLCRLDGVLSRQIDCMIVRGEGEQVPYTKHWIYPVSKAVAVLEVKKTLFGDDLGDAMDLMADIHDRFFEVPPDLPAALLADSWRSIRGTDLPVGSAIEKLSPAERLLRRSLFKNAILPARIVIGFGGYKSEATLRMGFAESLWKRVNKKSVVTFRPAALPDLIVGRTAALIKLNGMPYPGPYSAATQTWELFGSSGQYPMRALLEILWTRLTYYHGVSTSVFGEDLEVEKINRVLTAEYSSSGDQHGWTYRFLDVPTKTLAEGGTAIEWMPTVLSQAAFVVINILCAGDPVSVAGEGFQRMLLDTQTSITALASELSEAHLAFLDDEGCFRLLTKSCQAAIVPGLGYVAAENESGRFSRWLLRWLDRNGGTPPPS